MKKVFFIFLFSILFAFVLEASRKERQRAERLGGLDTPVKSRYEPQAPEDLPYDVRDRFHLLHRLSLRYFYQGNFVESTESFSSAYRDRKEEPEFLVHYALCSLLFPEPHRSLKRSERLIQEAKNFGAPEERTLLIEALIAFQKDDLEKSMSHLTKASRLSDRYQASKILARIKWERSPILDDAWIRSFMPEPRQPLQWIRNQKKGRKKRAPKPEYREELKLQKREMELLTGGNTVR